jgi:hypothetical protein
VPIDWSDFEAYECALAAPDYTWKKQRRVAKQGYERTLSLMAKTPVRSTADALAAVDWLGRFEYATVSTHEAIVRTVKAYVAGQARSGASLPGA